MLLDSGQTADVYAFGDTLVLRTCRRGGDVTAEADIMRRVGALVDGAVTVDEAGAVLADPHRRLHRVPVGIAHLDLHPANVMLTDRGPVVIDRRNARTGRSPDLDLAVTANTTTAQAARLDAVRALVEESAP